MMKSLFLAALLFAVTAAENTQAAPCKDLGVANAPHLVFDPNDVDAIAGLKVSLIFGLNPATFPFKEISAAPDACRRGAFKAAGAELGLFGDDANSPPRWAIGADPGRIAYIAVVPDPMDALEWSKKRQADPKTPAELKLNHAFYALAVTDGRLRRVYLIYRALPDDYRLAVDMRTALEGGWTPLATFDEETYEVTLGDLRQAATRDPQIGGQRPKSLRFDAPDGSYFIADSDGLARHRPSGLACPKALGAYERKDLAVLNPAEGGLDVLCRYFATGSWTSVFATKLPGQSLDEVFAGYVADAQASTPSAGDLPAPGQIRSGRPMKSIFWKGREGSYQAMWVLKRGDWYIEIRTTYAPGEERRLTELAQALVDMQ